MRVRRSGRSHGPWLILSKRQAMARAAFEGAAIDGGGRGDVLQAHAGRIEQRDRLVVAAARLLAGHQLGQGGVDVRRRRRPAPSGRGADRRSRRTARASRRPPALWRRARDRSRDLSELSAPTAAMKVPGRTSSGVRKAVLGRRRGDDDVALARHREIGARPHVDLELLPELVGQCLGGIVVGYPRHASRRVVAAAAIARGLDAALHACAADRGDARIAAARDGGRPAWWRRRCG